jgi:hypothetical protein
LFKLFFCKQLISCKATNLLRKKSLMVLRHCMVTVVSQVVWLSYCVSDIFKSDKIPSDTVPTYHSESPWVGTILLACYTSIPPVVLSPAPPASEGSSLKVPRVSNPASPAAKPRGNKHCPPSEYTPTEVIRCFALTPTST